MSSTDLQRRVPVFFLWAAICVFSGPAWTQTATGLSWPGCADLQAADFKKVPLTINHPTSPTKMMFAPDGRMFFANVGGAVWVYDPKTNATTTIANIPVKGGGTAWGMVGMVLDPNFTANNWIYFLYSANPTAANPANKIFYQVWRYTLAGGKLDLPNGIKVIEYMADNGAFPVDHSGGGMAFDAQGNLYFSSGENSDWNLNYGNIDETRTEFNSLRTAGNTNDLRGKVNRIHPEPDGKYTIPAGNLFPPGTDSTRPEIYAMGFRNPWSLNVDKVTGALLVADVGPQATDAAPTKGPAGMDEFDAVPAAGNYGWPMFMGPNIPYNDYDYAKNAPGPFFDPAAPANNSKLNTGLKLLPAAHPATVAYGKDGLNNPWAGFDKGGAVPISGPLYRYDGKNPSKTKLPPHFEGKWFVADAFQKWIKVIGLDPLGSKAVTVTQAFPGMATFASTASYSILSMAIGPDGALYVSEYQSNLTYRIEYAGTCLPDVTPSALARGGAPAMRATGGAAWGVLLAPVTSGLRKVDLGPGQHGFALFDLQGRKVWDYSRPESGGAATVEIPAALGAGQILWARF